MVKYFRLIMKECLLEGKLTHMENYWQLSISTTKNSELMNWLGLSASSRKEDKKGKKICDQAKLYYCIMLP